MRRSRSSVSRGIRTKDLRPHFETLEDRSVPSCSTISGHVYHDANSNGLFDAGETPIAGSTVELQDANGVVVASAITDANGYYEFDQDQTIPQAETSLTREVVFGPTETNFNQQGLVNQFDPTLGELLRVEIIHEGAITSEVKVENTSPTSGSTITGTVSGTLRLTAPNVDSTITLQENVGNYAAGAYDGAIDFTGGSGTSFGVNTAEGSRTIVLTGADMDAYKGTGLLDIAEEAVATSMATGGGNLVVQLESTGRARIRVVYHYVPSNCLKPGNYTIVQTQQPPGYLDGRESTGGVVLNTPPGIDRIPVTLTDQDVPNNDFGELLPGSISGFVYHDRNNDGVKGPGEEGIAGVQVQLSGDAAATAFTDANGFYSFTDLDPGTYTVQEIQPTAFLDGKDAVGSLGGTLADDLLGQIVLPSGGQGIHYDFGEVLPGKISGHVFQDQDNDGVRDAGEPGIAGVSLALTGVDDQGFVNRTATTDAQGYYEFLDLRPGTYSVNETQPAGWLDGKDALGTLGGLLSDDAAADILLPSAGVGENYDFGEIRPGRLSGRVFHDRNDNGVMDAGEEGIPGVQVELQGTDDRGAVDRIAVTDAQGGYEFLDLRPGTYAIQEVQPVGWLDGKEHLGTLQGVVQPDRFASIMVGQGSVGEQYDFGELLPATLSGHVYHDLNDNGLREPGEAGIPGTTVDLTWSTPTGVLNIQTQTDASGYYEFVNLLPGTYTIRETQPAGWNDGKDKIGTQGGTAGNDIFSAIVVTSGLVGTDNDFGEKEPELADVGIVKTASQTQVLIGTVFTYTLTVTNHGPYTARGVEVADHLPDGLIFLGAHGPDWQGAMGHGLLVMKRASLAPGESSTIVVSVQASLTPGTLQNTGVVTTTTPDTDPNNNISTVIVTVVDNPGTPVPRPFNPVVFAQNIPFVSKLQAMPGGLQYMDQTRVANLAFIGTVHKTLTGAEPGLATWLTLEGQLNAGTSRAQLVSMLMNTTQYRTQQVNGLYQAYLGRDAGAAELAQGIAFLGNGGSEIDLSLALLTGDEYLNQHGSSQALLTSYYSDILYRTPGTSTLIAGAQAMDNQPLQQFAAALMLSDEALGYRIDDLYRETLGRPAQAGEIAQATAQIRSGQLTPDQLLRDLMASEEFLRRAHLEVLS